jgi:SAM-dependent methyltransferase
MNLSKLSSYQNPEGQLNDKLAPRTDMRISLVNPLWFKNKTVLDIGCNNGFWTRFAMKNGARRAVGVDASDCIEGAKELAKEERLGCEFWQLDVESIEFQKFCPRFDIIILFSCLTKLKDKEKFLDWLDGRAIYQVLFESNHGEENKEHIELLQKYMYFESVEYLGPSEIPSKPHYMWNCLKSNHQIRYQFIQDIPVEFVAISDVIRWDEETVLDQHRRYSVEDERFLALKEDIRKRGIRTPIILQEYKGQIRGFQGCHRYLAAKQLGYKCIPARVIRGHIFRHLQQDEN